MVELRPRGSSSRLLYILCDKYLTRISCRMPEFTFNTIICKNTVLVLIKLTKFSVYVRCGSVAVAVIWSFVFISSFFAIFKNFVHSLEPGETPIYSAYMYHQVPNYVQPSFNIAKYFKTVSCGCGAVAFIFSNYLKSVLYNTGVWFLLLSSGSFLIFCMLNTLNTKPFCRQFKLDMWNFTTVLLLKYSPCVMNNAEMILHIRLIYILRVSVNTVWRFYTLAK